MIDISVVDFVRVMFAMSHSTNPTSQPAFTCSKLTKETIEQGVKHVQS